VTAVLLVAALLAVAFVLVVLGGLLAAADSALSVLSRADLEEIARGSKRRRAIEALADDPGAHVNALNFFRVLAETAAAVLVTIALVTVFDTWWIALIVSAAVMTAVSFVLVGSSPRSVGRAHAEGIIATIGGLVRGVRIVLGPLAGLLVAIGDRVTPGRVRRRPRATCSKPTTVSSSTRCSRSATPSSARSWCPGPTWSRRTRATPSPR
jgi:CBS domain containing-hemolysin-like protein